MPQNIGVNVSARRAVVRIMCQLLGMNSLKPAELGFSLAGFLRRGGETDEHADGWGIALYEELGCKLVIDERASASSPVAEWVQRNTGRSRNVIAHIRKATQGEVTATNCHPFVRHLWGQEWCFAHNGNLDTSKLGRPEKFIPCGQTDSELAFCLLFDALLKRFGEQAPPEPLLRAALSEISAGIAAAGTFNYVLSNGDALFAHRSTELHYVERAWPFGRAQLLDCLCEIDFARHNQPDDRMIILATQPLTNEDWQPLPIGRVSTFRGGRLLGDEGPEAR